MAALKTFQTYINLDTKKRSFGCFTAAVPVSMEISQLIFCSRKIPNCLNSPDHIAGSFKSQLIDYFRGHIVSWEAFGRFMLIRTK